MITLKHIEIYKKYNGDGDDFVRRGTVEEKEIMNYYHWSLVDNLVQEIFLIKGGKASDSFAEQIRIKLNENCDSLETIEALLGIETEEA